MPYLDKMTGAQLRAWLKAHGHDKAKIDKVKMTTAKDKRAALLTLHGVKEKA